MRETLEDIEAGAVKDPMQVAQQSNKHARLPKRFYEKAEAVEVDSVFCIHLDGRAVKTPTKQILTIETRLAAELIAREWQAQKEYIDPLEMPATRLVNTAIDGVAKDMQAVKEDIIRFAGSDLLCYRAESPDGLAALQCQHWDPLIDWALTALNARFLLTEGVIHIAQPAETMAAFSAHIGLIEKPVALASLHSLTALSGSAVIAMAMFKTCIDIDAAWSAAHVDEDWQIAQWGADEEAQALRINRRRDFQAASDLLISLE